MTSRTEALETGMEWYGYMTTANYRQIAERVERMLKGKRYTHIAMSYVYTRDGELPAYLDVRAGQRLKLDWTDRAKNFVKACDASPESGLVGFMFSDTYGLHHYSTDKVDQSRLDMDALSIPKDAPNYHEAYWAVYISFKGMREIRIVSRVADGARLESVYAIDTNLEYDVQSDREMAELGLSD